MYNNSEGDAQGVSEKLISQETPEMSGMATGGQMRLPDLRRPQVQNQHTAPIDQFGEELEAPDTLAGLLLGIQHGIAIKQKVEVMKALTTCDLRNDYSVHALTAHGEATEEVLLRGKEVTGGCSRNFSTADCRPFRMNVLRVHQNQVPGQQAPPPVRVARLERARNCGFLACCKTPPPIRVFHTEPEHEVYIGKIVTDFNCSIFSYKVYDRNEQVRLVVETNCCQKGIWLRCCCESCERLESKLWTGDKLHQQAGIQKRGFGSCKKNYEESSDILFVQWPEQATWEDRLLLTCTLMITHYMQFDEHFLNFTVIAH